MPGFTYGTTNGATYGGSDGGVWGFTPPLTTQFRARDPVDDTREPI